jgi:GT2 family glycosyltransferase
MVYLSGERFSMQEPPELSIIIVNWNTRDLLRDCLNSVYAETEKTSFEVLVVDNASSDGSAEMVKREFLQVMLIENEDNLGFARANNQAIRQSSGSYILLLNPDTVVLSGALDKMVAFMRAHPDVDASGPMILNLGGSLHPPTRGNRYAFDFCAKFLLEECLLSYVPRLLIRKLGRRETYSSQPRQVNMVLGTCMMMTRTALDKVGLLDEQYFLFAEETDWFYRLKLLGGKTYFIPEARIVHHFARSVKQTDTVLKYSYRSRHLFMKKHHKKVQAYFPRFMVAIDCFAASCAFLLLQAVVKGDKRDEIKWKLRCRWRAFLWAIGREF